MFVIKQLCLYPDVLCYCCLIDVFSAMEIVKLTQQSRNFFNALQTSSYFRAHWQSCFQTKQFKRNKRQNKEDKEHDNKIFNMKSYNQIIRWVTDAKSTNIRFCYSLKYLAKTKINISSSTAKTMNAWKI